jgi:hypothetical protein
MNRSKFFRVSTLAAIGWALILQASLASAAVSPASYTDTMAPGHSNDVAKTVGTPEIPARPDIIFLADTTGSMSGAIANVQANAAAIMTAVDAGTAGTPYFAAAQYRDTGDGALLFRVDQSLTSDQTAVNTAIGTWAAGGGGDTWECQLNALNQLAGGAAGTFRDSATPVIVWFGDASGHDPCNGATEVGATAALVAGEIIVIAVGVTSGANGLDDTGQATRITDATGGSFSENTPPGDVADAILAALSNLPITVTPTPVGCTPLNVSFNPTSDTVTSGDDASFTETVAVPSSSAVAGQVVTCQVDFEDENGNFLGSQDIEVTIPLAIDLSPDTATNELSADNAHTVTAYVSSLDVALGLGGKTVEFEVTGTNAGYGASTTTDDDGVATFGYSVPFSCDSLGTDTITGCTDRADSPLVFGTCDSVTKDWVDTTPPVATCVETENPHGNNKPNAPGGGGQGQNQDGYYQLEATDDLVIDCAPLELFITDDGSGTVFGPFAVGTEIKYTEEIDAVVEIKPIGGRGNNNSASDTDWHIIGHGDAILTAVDQSGNTSAEVNCLVPPPPQ